MRALLAAACSRSNKSAREIVCLPARKVSRTCLAAGWAFANNSAARTSSPSPSAAARSRDFFFSSSTGTPARHLCQKPHSSSTSIMRTGDFSQRPREISFQTRSATRASTSPSLTIRRASRIVSGATENSGNFAAKRARRRIRTGSSAKAGLTCRKMRALRSLWPPQGSMSTPSEDRAMALMVKSRRLRSSSSETSGLA